MKAIELEQGKIVGVYDDEDPPVPIPNTVVKLISAENTWRVTAWEPRSMPTQKETGVFPVSFLLPCFYLCLFSAFAHPAKSGRAFVYV